MQDTDILPQEEGSINGAVDGARREAARVAPWVAPAKISRESLPLPWIIATAPIWA